MYQRSIFIKLILLLPIALHAQVRIGQRTIRYNDTARQRPLLTEIWYPTNDVREPADIPGYPFVHHNTIRNAQLPVGKHPLILLSHGTGGNRLGLEWLADALVQKGFVAVAVDHWGNTYDNRIALSFVTPWQRPQDLSFVLTQILKDPELSAMVDTTRIGAAGFSIGGYTVIALAGGKMDLDALFKFSKTPEGIRETNIPEYPDLMKSIDENEVKLSFKKSPELKDKRIKAFFAMSPAVGQSFPSRINVSAVTAPLYIVSAQSDSITPVQFNAAWYHKLIPASIMYIVPGKAGHYVFLNEAVGETRTNGGILFNDDVTVDRRAIHEKVSTLAIDFFKQQLR